MTLLALDRNGNPIQAGRPLTTHNIAVGAASARPAQALSPNTGLIRIVATAKCHIAIGADPTATTDDFYLPAGVVDYIAIQPGVDTLAVVRADQDGALFVTEIA